MTIKFTCEDKAALVSYLYDEVDAGERATIEAHLLTCGACASEVSALRGVRSELASWSPPEADLGFTIVRTTDRAPAQVLRPARWWKTVPVWAQAAAAVLVVAAGAAIANIQVRSGPEGFVVTTGWMSPSGARTAPVPAADGDAWKTALASLERDLRNEIRSARPVADTAAVPASADDVTVRRVQQLLSASEERQNRELALRLTQLVRDMDIQRRADLVRIEQVFGQFEGRTGLEIARQRQMLNSVIRVSGPPKQ